MDLQVLVATHGYGIKVKPLGQHGLPFTVVESRYGLYYFVQYEDGRTGYMDKRLMEAQYELWNGLTCTEEAIDLCKVDEEGSTPSGSTQEEEQCLESETPLLMASQPSSPTLLSAFHLLLRQFFG